MWLDFFISLLVSCLRSSSLNPDDAVKFESHAAYFRDTTLVDAVPPIRRPVGQPGRPRSRPAKLHGDKGYAYPACRRALRCRGITPRIARRGVDSSERLGGHRRVVERTNAWVLAYRRLAVRSDRQAASVLALLHLACALICLRFLQRVEEL